MTHGNKSDIISQLRKDMLLWEGYKAPDAGGESIVQLGAVNAAFPNNTFPIGAIHEMLCPLPEQAAATCGFVAGILSALVQQGVCLWISASRKLFPPSLTVYQANPDHVIFIDVPREKDVLWVTEEALKCRGLGAVVSELREVSFAQSRRLQLAVESSGVTGFMLRTAAGKPGASTCAARWQITALPCVPEKGLPGIGFPRWQVELLKVRNGLPGKWELEWVVDKFIVIEKSAEIVEQHLKAG